MISIALRRTLGATALVIGLGALTACASNTPGSPPVPDTTSTERAPTVADTAAQKYVDCLNANGVDAIVDQDGRVAYGIGTPSDGDMSVSAGDAVADTRTAAENTCTEAVPEYTPRNDDER